MHLALEDLVQSKKNARQSFDGGRFSFQAFAV